MVKSTSLRPIWRRIRQPAGGVGWLRSAFGNHEGERALVGVRQAQMPTPDPAQSRELGGASGQRDPWSALRVAHDLDLSEPDAIGPARAQALHDRLLGGEARSERRASVSHGEAVGAFQRRERAFEKTLTVLGAQCGDAGDFDQVDSVADDHLFTAGAGKGMLSSRMKNCPWSVACLVLAALAACSKSTQTPNTPANPSPSAQNPANKPKPDPEMADLSKLPPLPPGSRPTEKIADFPAFKIETTKAGTGAAIEYGQKGKFHYVGTLPNGRQFDSSRDRGEPSEFALQSNGLIKGWILGLEGMKVGERRRLIVPPELAYGKTGNGAVPPDATLVFDIELCDIVKPEPPASQPTGDASKK